MQTRHSVPRIRSIAARIVLSVLLLASPLPPAWSLDTELPDLGNSAGSLMTPKRERDLGKAFKIGRAHV